MGNSYEVNVIINFYVHIYIYYRSKCDGKVTCIVVDTLFISHLHPCKSNFSSSDKCPLMISVGEISCQMSP